MERAREVRWRVVGWLFEMGSHLKSGEALSRELKEVTEQARQLSGGKKVLGKGEHKGKGAERQYV